MIAIQKSIHWIAFDTSHYEWPWCHLPLWRKQKCSRNNFLHNWSEKRFICAVGITKSEPQTEVSVYFLKSPESCAINLSFACLNPLFLEWFQSFYGRIVVKHDIPDIYVPVQIPGHSSFIMILRDNWTIKYCLFTLNIMFCPNKLIIYSSQCLYDITLCGNLSQIVKLLFVHTSM